MELRAKIAIDSSHNNRLTLEATSYSDFTQFLFTSGFQVGRIQAGFDSISKIRNYDVILLSTPRNKILSEEEIEILEKYVREGGNLLIISSAGGDYQNRTNLNELARKFKFEYLSDEINDSMNYAKLQKRPLISKLKPHTLSEQVKKLVFSSACSLNINEYIEEEKDIKIEVIAKSGLNAWHRIYNGEEWEQEDFPKKPLALAINYYKGRIVAMGTLSMFSSLGSEYGFFAYDNDIFISNILRWLLNTGTSEDMVLNISLNKELYQWAELIAEKENWENISNLLNVGIKYFKDNYKKIITEMQARKIEIKKAYERKRAKREKEAEQKILDLMPARKKEDLEDIIQTLEEITGEKYELSIDLEGLEEESDKKPKTEDKDN